MAIQNIYDLNEISPTTELCQDYCKPVFSINCISNKPDKPGVGDIPHVSLRL